MSKMRKLNIYQIFAIMLLLAAASRSDGQAYSGQYGNVHASPSAQHRQGPDQKPYQSSGQQIHGSVHLPPSSPTPSRYHSPPPAPSSGPKSSRYQVPPSAPALSPSVAPTPSTHQSPALAAPSSGAQLTPYSLSYSVNDPRTGDVHSHQESRDSNGVVTGQYQLIEPDGTLRIVEYTAGSFGFIPKIRRIPHYAPPPPLPPYSALPQQGSAPSHAAETAQGRSPAPHPPTHPGPVPKASTRSPFGPQTPTVAPKQPIPHPAHPATFPQRLTTPQRPAPGPGRISLVTQKLTTTTFRQPGPVYPAPAPTRSHPVHQRPAPVIPTQRSVPHHDDEEPPISY